MSSGILGGWARLLLQAFAESGVRDVVVSPGSRSTPFLLAAQRNPDLRLWSVIDERSAGFFALGQGRWSGRPSLLLCTSGTAAAHYLPAVIEAEMAGVPLLVLTADRPAELADCGAPQTVDQIGLFGRHVRSFVELGAPEAHPGALRGLRRRTAQAVLESRWPEPGAVHLNARARKPLEPRPGDEELVMPELGTVLAEAPPRAFAPARDPEAHALELLVGALAGEERGLIVCGSAGLEQVRLRRSIFELARRTGYPLVTEAASQLRFTGGVPPGVVRLDAAAVLLDVPEVRARYRPRVVVQIGRAPLAPGVEALLAEAPGSSHFVLTETIWHDPGNRAGAMLFGDLHRTLAATLGRLGDGPPLANDWAGGLARDDEVVRSIVAATCNGSALEEGAVTRLALQAVPPGGLLALGNSLPIRHVERYGAGVDTDLRVWAQRGANGIDGLISGVAGTLSLAEEAKTPPAAALLLLGDVSLLHDLGGLALARRIRLPFVVLVINNDGGRIFEQLPVAELPGVDLDLWVTPHGLNFEAAARLFGLPYACAQSREGLLRALEEAGRRLGPTLVEARVDPHGARVQSARLSLAVRERLGAIS